MTDKLTHLPHDPHHPVRIPAETGSEATASTSTGSGYPGWSSTNWSGYAIGNNTNKAYQSVSATWKVPQVQTRAPSQPQPTSWWGRLWQWLSSLFGGGGSGSTGTPDSYSAAWIGIDGFNNSNLIQTGTAQNIVNGQPQYYAWWETLPNPETQIDSSQYPVSPGDSMVAHITEQSDGTWQIALGNQTQGWVFQKTGIQYQGPQTSVEWIMEAPQLNGNVTNLANYGEMTFSSILINGSSANLQPSNAGVMMQNGTQISTPSLPNSTGNAFNVGYGSAEPSPPTA